MNAKKQIVNAIKWIDELPNYKQAPKENRGKLGNEKDGYCCLGVGCVVLDIAHEGRNFSSPLLMNAVGLLEQEGEFTDGDRYFFNEWRLASINDNTNAGFKRIAKLLRTHPDWMFTEEVAKGIKAHYSNN